MPEFTNYKGPGGMKKIIAVLFFFVAVAGVVFVIIYPNHKKNKEIQITNFEECAAAGYPIMESYPRQCSTPSGKFFVEQVIRER